MNFLKEHKRLVWSLLGAILIIGAIIYVNVTTYLDMRRANIFDEIYQETSISYVFSQLSGVEEKEREIYDGNLNETGKYKRVINYTSEATPEGYAWITIEIYFDNEARSCYIGFEKTLDSNMSLLIRTTYHRKELMLTKTLVMSAKKGSESSQRIDDDEEIKAYLKGYGITAADLDSYYDEIINKKVLTDWCSIYESKFSPDNYGDVTIKTQWENWNW